MAISITICNLALGELRAPPIVDIAEETIEARECARFYPQCLKALLERFDWSFATKTASLALFSDNPRASEWRYAFAAPADLATALRLVPPVTGWPAPDGVAPVAPMLDQPFLVEGTTIFTQIPGAILEYAARDVAEALMPATFVDALAYALAARLAVPLRDSRETKAQLLQQAELATQRAIADDRDRQPARDHVAADEVGVVRSGMGQC